MMKLMKYEFRKTMFSKLVFLVITAVLEVLFFLGMLLEKDSLLGGSIAGLVLCAVIGISYIGLDSLLAFHRDLNTKQSYMLFLTPRNSYQILGAKVLENGLSIFLAGAFFAVLAAVDISAALMYIGGLKELLRFIDAFAVSIQVDINITAVQAVLAFFTVLAGWLEVLAVGDLAIVLSATVLSGKRLSGVVSFILFLVITSGIGWLQDKAIPVFGSDELQMGVVIGVTLAVVALIYALTGWIMEKKLSV